MAQQRSHLLPLTGTYACFSWAGWQSEGFLGIPGFSCGPQWEQEGHLSLSKQLLGSQSVACLQHVLSLPCAGLWFPACGAFPTASQKSQQCRMWLPCSFSLILWRLGSVESFGFQLRCRDGLEVLYKPVINLHRHAFPSAVLIVRAWGKGLDLPCALQGTYCTLRAEEKHCVVEWL